jgi:hypothetical protein
VQSYPWMVPVRATEYSVVPFVKSSNIELEVPAKFPRAWAYSRNWPTGVAVPPPDISRYVEKGDSLFFIRMAFFPWFEFVCLPSKVVRGEVSFRHSSIFQLRAYPIIGQACSSRCLAKLPRQHGGWSLYGVLTKRDRSL